MRAIADIPNKLKRIAHPVGGMGDAHNGVAKVRVGKAGVLFSNGMGWDHVSVSLATRCPTWEEMCAIKDLFFEAEDLVVQYHPPKTQYVNCHPYCLHLWRPEAGGIPLPPAIMIA